MAKPDVASFFQSASVGAIYARGFVTVLVILALGYACYQAWQIVHALRLLDQAPNARQANDTIAPSGPERGHKGQSESWR
jgi:hypothetical protein